MLVFLTFMPIGAIIGGIGCGALFGFMAARDDAIAVRPASPGPNGGRPGR